MKITLVILLTFLCYSLASAQFTTWVPYDSLRYVKSMASNGNSMWIGSHGYGLIKLNRTNGQKELHLNANNGLPSSYVNAIHIDPQGNKWFGTGNPFEGGVVKFDTNFVVTYDTCNSLLPSHYVTAIAQESNGTLWFGTYGGLAKFDGTNWTKYDSSSGLPSTLITCIGIASNGYKYFGTVDKGLIQYNGSTFVKRDSASGWIDNDFVTSVALDNSNGVWVTTYGGGVSYIFGGITKYNTSNSSLPDNYVTSVLLDASGNKWFATGNFYGGPGGGGVARLSGSSWTVFKTSNSNIPTNHINVLALDAAGDVWMGGGEPAEVGIAVYKWMNDVEETVRSGGIALEQNYPNPAKSSTHIRYTLDASAAQESPVRIRILDLLGNELAALSTTGEPDNTYEIAFNTESLPNGTYLYTLQAGNRIESRTMSVLHD